MGTQRTWGFSASHWLEKQIKMIAIACLAAVPFAEPEAKADADAALLYGGYYGGYGLGYAGYGLGYGYGYPYAAGYHYLGKRSADAEPEAKADADPALLYGAYYGGLGYAGYGYAGLGYGYPYAAGYHYLGKRSADAEPEAKADPALL